MSEGAKPVTIRRERGFYAIFRKLILDVDGAEFLRIKAGEAVEVTLPVMAKALHMRMDWVTSDPFDLSQVHAGDTLVISVVKRSFQQMRDMKTIPFAIRIERG